MLTRQFWLGENGAIVRSIRTAAQTAIAAIGVGQTNLFSADIQNVAALSVSAAVLSILMSLDRNTPSNAAVAAPAEPIAVSAPTTEVTAIDPIAAAKAGCGEVLR